MTIQQGRIAATVSFHPTTGAPCEVFFTKRSKSGTEIEETMRELGIRMSKLMQGEPDDL